jgi:hypothetical protein
MFSMKGDLRMNVSVLGLIVILSLVLVLIVVRVPAELSGEVAERGCFEKS